MTDFIPTEMTRCLLLQKYNQKPGLIRHALAVEAVMAHFAKKFGEEEEKWRSSAWSMTWIMEQFPDEHCRKCVDLFKGTQLARRYPGRLAHGWGICTDIEPKTSLEKTLYAVDKIRRFASPVPLW
ncbi:MAG: hypothetical protein U5K27_01905 [Desulfotignum sp.]|nr:hypothetical protein [Desulfotignum sp.]